MAIEFRCTQCQKLLRTQDDTAGKQAKCPHCGAMVQIPSAVGDSLGGPLPSAGNPFESGAGGIPGSSPGGTPFGVPGGTPFGGVPGDSVPGGLPPAGGYGAPPPGAAPPGGFNPYQSPVYGGPAPMQYAGVPGASDIVPTKIDFSDIIGRAWQIYQQRVWHCAGAMLVVFGISFAMYIFSYIAMFIGMLGGIIGLFLVMGIFSLAAMAFSIWLWLGVSAYFIRIARGVEPDFGELFAGGKHFVNGALLTLILLAVQMAIYFACVLPGIVLGVAGVDPEVAVVVGYLGVFAAMLPLIAIYLVFGQAQFLIADRGMGAMESLRTSTQITSGNRLTIFLLWIVLSIIYMLGSCALCIGVLFTGGFAFLAMAVAYLGMTGQTTGDQLRAYR